MASSVDRAQGAINCMAVMHTVPCSMPDAAYQMTAADGAHVWCVSCPWGPPDTLVGEPQCPLPQCTVPSHTPILAHTEKLVLGVHHVNCWLSGQHMPYVMCVLPWQVPDRHNPVGQSSSKAQTHRPLQQQLHGISQGPCAAAYLLRHNCMC